MDVSNPPNPSPSSLEGLIPLISFTSYLHSIFPYLQSACPLSSLCLELAVRGGGGSEAALLGLLEKGVKKGLSPKVTRSATPPIGLVDSVVAVFETLIWNHGDGHAYHLAKAIQRGTAHAAIRQVRSVFCGPLGDKALREIIDLFGNVHKNDEIPLISRVRVPNRKEEVEKDSNKIESCPTSILKSLKDISGRLFEIEIKKRELALQENYNIISHFQYASRGEEKITLDNFRRIFRDSKIARGNEKSLSLIYSRLGGGSSSGIDKDKFCSIFMPENPQYKALVLGRIRLNRNNIIEYRSDRFPELTEKSIRELLSLHKAEADWWLSNIPLRNISEAEVIDFYNEIAPYTSSSKSLSNYIQSKFIKSSEMICLDEVYCLVRLLDFDGDGEVTLSDLKNLIN